MLEPSGPRAGCVGNGNPLSLLLLGDSSIAGVGAATQDQALSGRLTEDLSKTYLVDWRMLGTTGHTTKDALTAISDEPARETDVAILALGVNDVTTETGITTWLRTYQQLVEVLRRDWGAKLIIVSGLPPMGAFPALPQPLRWYLGLQARAHQDALFLHFQEDHDVICMPLVFDLDPSAMAKDGFHPGPQVYEAWAQDVAAIIRPHLSRMQQHPYAHATADAHRSIEI